MVVGRRRILFVYYEFKRQLKFLLVHERDIKFNKSTFYSIINTLLQIDDYFKS